MALNKIQSFQNKLKILSNKSRNKIIPIKNNPLDKNYSQNNKQSKNKTQNYFKSNLSYKRNNVNEQNKKFKSPNERLIASYKQDKKRIIFFLLGCVILLNLFNPILSHYSITLNKTKTLSPNDYDPILNYAYIGKPDAIYLDDIPVDASYISYTEEYLEFNCTESQCRIKLQWDIKIPLNTYDNNRILENIITYQEIDEGIIEINANEMFKNCDTITYIDFTFYKTQNFISMASMFESCTSLEKIGGLSLKDVNDFSCSFKDCISLTSVGINDIKITNEALEIRMDYMFFNCTKLQTLNFGEFNITNIISMNSMFLDCFSLKNLSININTEKVLDMNSMFENCQELETLDLSSFVGERVENISRMFYNCSKLEELNLSNFVADNVFDASYMFYNCKALKTLNLSLLEAKKVI